MTTKWDFWNDANAPRSNLYAKDLASSAEFRRRYAAERTIVKRAEMPVEFGPQGVLKHLVHEDMGTQEYCLDIYEQYLAGGGRSGKHRHLSEEVLYVIEGSGYDLHWDLEFDCADEYSWDMAKEPKRFEWEAGDFVYIPPYCGHQHFNSDPENPVRFVSITSRIVKKMGFDWMEQLEDAPEHGAPEEAGDR